MYSPASRTAFLLMLLALVLASPGLSSDQDRDGDGHRATRYGGDDCDDRDVNRFPGNVEICDTRDHDEDCDPTTFGRRDQDGDGQVDAQCCNTTSSGSKICGADCDDANRAVQTDAQICDGESVRVCGPQGVWTDASCPTGTICVGQPNGTGVCMSRPDGYRAAAQRPASTPAAVPSGETAQIAPTTQPMRVSASQSRVSALALIAAAESAPSMTDTKQRDDLTAISSLYRQGKTKEALAHWEQFVRKAGNRKRADLDTAMYWVLNQAYVKPDPALAKTAEALRTETKKARTEKERQKVATSFQNLDQKSSQLYEQMSKVMKAMNEMSMGTTRNML